MYRLILHSELDDTEVVRRLGSEVVTHQGSPIVRHIGSEVVRRTQFWRNNSRPQEKVSNQFQL